MNVVNEAAENVMELTPEEFAKRKEEMLSYFRDQIPFLNKQKEYQTLLTEIEELRARQVRAQVMIAQILAAPPQHPEHSEYPEETEPNAPQSQEAPKRTLKKN